jgi:hypothetical protein
MLETPINILHALNSKYAASALSGAPEEVYLES